MNLGLLILIILGVILLYFWVKEFYRRVKINIRAGRKWSDSRDMDIIIPTLVFAGLGLLITFVELIIYLWTIKINIL